MNAGARSDPRLARELALGDRVLARDSAMGTMLHPAGAPLDRERTAAAPAGIVVS